MRSIEAQHQQMWVGGEKYLVSGKPGTVGEHIRRSERLLMGEFVPEFKLS